MSDLDTEYDILEEFWTNTHDMLMKIPYDAVGLYWRAGTKSIQVESLLCSPKSKDNLEKLKIMVNEIHETTFFDAIRYGRKE